MTSCRGSRSQASGQPEPPAVHEGFPTPATVADVRPVSWDVGPGALCRAKPKATVEHSPTTYVLRQLSSCTFPFPRRAPSASSVPSFICGVPALRTSVGPRASSPRSGPRLSSSGHLGKRMSISFSLLWLCLLLHFPQE